LSINGQGQGMLNQGDMQGLIQVQSMNQQLQQQMQIMNSGMQPDVMQGMPAYNRMRQQNQRGMPNNARQSSQQMKGPSSNPAMT